MAKQLTEVHGLIYHRQRYREADVLAAMVTKELGFMTVLVRGGLRAKSKLASATVNFSQGSYVVLQNGKGLASLRTVRSAQQIVSLFSDLTKNAYASFCLDLTRHAFLEYEPLGRYYQLLMTVLNKIAAVSEEGCEIWTQLLELRLLAAYGVAPSFARCVVGGEEAGTFDYSIGAGGVVCSRHWAQVSGRLRLSAKAVALMRTLALVPVDQLGKIAVSKALAAESRQAIDRIYARTVDLNLASKRFLDELRLLN